LLQKWHPFSTKSTIKLLLRLCKRADIAFNLFDNVHFPVVALFRQCRSCHQRSQERKKSRWRYAENVVLQIAIKMVHQKAM